MARYYCNPDSSIWHLMRSVNPSVKYKGELWTACNTMLIQTVRTVDVSDVRGGKWCRQCRRTKLWEASDA